jgi:methyl-accepting chemotaxis protein
MTIATRLFLLSMLSALGLLLLGVTGFIQLSNYNQKLEADLDEIGIGIHNLVDIEAAQIAFKTQVQEWKNILVRGNQKEDFDKYLKQFGDEEAKVQALLAKSAKSLRVNGDEAFATEAESLAKEHLALGTKYRDALKDFDIADREAGRKVDVAVKGMDRPVATGLSKMLEKVEAGELEHLGHQKSDARAHFTQIRYTSIAIVLAVIAGIGAFAFVTVRTIRQSLDTMRATAEAIPKTWDLRMRIPVTGNDEIADTGRAVNALLASFQDVVGRIVENARQTASSCQHMANSLSEIQQAVGNQNDATSAVAAGVEELATSFAQISSNASDSLAANGTATQSAVTGGQVISTASDGMRNIVGSVQSTATVIERVGQQSRDISTIVQVIREVADQTNLLALNAAIEAARAGEQGRGFAVVADEVRKLAEKTTSSAQEITRMIEAIQQSSGQAVVDIRQVVDQVQIISNSSNQAHDSIMEIRANTDKSERYSRDISYALDEQMSASTLIAQKVETIAQMSEENANSVAKAEEAMRDLEEESRTLQAAVARFVV